MSRMRIREAMSADLSALLAIEEATLAETWPELLSLGVDGPPLVLVYADPDPAGYALVVHDSSRTDSVADTGGADSVADTGGADSVADTGGNDEQPAYLVELAVAPPRQREGIGTALVSALVDRLDDAGCDRIRVTARASDDTALAFYREHGFTVVDRLPDHYENGDGLALVRHLDE